MAALLGLIIIGVTLGILLINSESETFAGLAMDDVAQIGALGALFIFILMGSGMLRRHPIRDIINGIVFWAGLCASIVLAYTLFAEENVTPEMMWSRLTGETQRVMNTEEQAVEIRARGSQFFAEARVNGQPLSLLFDTGATTVALSHQDAMAIGVDMAALLYFIPVETANGRTMAAPVTLAEIAIGPIVVEDVRAVVAQPDSLRFSLLGMSFLNKIVSYEVRQDRLILRN